MEKIADGIKLLKNRLKTLPSSPGVYRMLDESGNVLYVGKAKNLKNRLSSYTVEGNLSTRIRRMVFLTRDLVLVQTKTEAEALLLEANLIKSLKPKYNILFRDDSSYPSILITDEDTPRLMHHRGAKRKKGSYFGPYPNPSSMYQTLDMMERVFLLRTCSDSVFKNRTRPCLKYDVKRCSAPCVHFIPADDYQKLVEEAKDFLKGKGQKVHKTIQKRMEKFSQNHEYEKAARERDRLQALSKVLSNQKIATYALDDADVFGLYATGGKVAVQVFYYRNGQHIGNQLFYPKNTHELDEGEILRQFITQHYNNRQVPKLVVTSHKAAEADILAEALSVTAGKKITLRHPKQGDVVAIVKQAVNNAKESLQRKQAQSQNWEQQMAAFGDILGLDEPPKRVEAFDISNISGRQPVASMVVAGEDEMLKSQYRKFAIKGKDTPDDYAMMAEALTRRYKKARAENNLPDVVLIDGGMGHLNTAIKVFKELGMNTTGHPTVCAIAKGPERDKGLEKIWKAGESEPLPIPHNTPLIFLLQRIRDEAHRFAIGYHRQKRSKSLTQSTLDDVPGIGGKRKKALLLHFGSAVQVKDATVEELQRVEGISRYIAQKIYDWFHA